MVTRAPSGSLAYVFAALHQPIPDGRWFTIPLTSTRLTSIANVDMLPLSKKSLFKEKLWFYESFF